MQISIGFPDGGIRSYNGRQVSSHAMTKTLSTTSTYIQIPRERTEAALVINVTCIGTERAIREIY